MFWLLEVGLFAVGLVLLRRGWRGRVVDDHPLCARCGFDLIGASVVGRCAECGSQLGNVRSLKRGHRQHRPRFLMGGGLLIVLAVMPIGVVVAARVSGSTLESHLPSAVLLWRLKGDGTLSHSAAAGELFHRMTRGVLSRGTEDALIDKALLALEDSDSSTRDVWAASMVMMTQAGQIPESQRGRIIDWLLAKQKDYHRHWDPYMGSLAVTNLVEGDPNDPRFQIYLKQAAAPELVFLDAAPLFADEPAVIAADFAWRGGGSEIQATPESLDLDGAELRRLVPGTASSSSTSPLDLCVAQFPVGDHEVRVRFRVAFIGPSLSESLASAFIEVRRSIHVVSASSPAEAAARIRDRLKLLIHVDPRPKRYQVDGQTWVKFETGSSPGFSAETRVELGAYARRGLAEVPLGSFELVLGKHWSDFSLRVNEKDFGSSPFDLVLTVRRLTVHGVGVFDGPGTLDLAYPVDPRGDR